MRTFEVSDPNDFEAEIAADRKARKEGPRLSPQAKQRIEMLCGMHRMTREVKIEGEVFKLQTLKAKETRAAVKAASSFDNNIDVSYQSRAQFVARSLCEISGQSMEDILGNNSLESVILFIDELDDVVLERLYAEYLVLTKEASDKYSIKNDAQSKELGEDLGKV